LVTIDEFITTNVENIEENQDGIIKTIPVVYYYTGSKEELHEIIDDFDKDILMFSNKIDHHMAQNFRNYQNIRVSLFTRYNNFKLMTVDELPLLKQLQESLKTLLDKSTTFEFINDPKMKKYYLRNEYGWSSHMTHTFKEQPFRLNYLEESSKGAKIVIFNVAFVDLNMLLNPTNEQRMQLINWYNMFLLLHGYKPSTYEPLRIMVHTML
jgi:hypothetical protein